MKKISKMTNDELVSEFEHYYDMIENDYVCYGTRDLFRYDFLVAEIGKRNGHIHKEIKVEFEESEEDE